VRNPEVTAAHLKLQAARRVHESCLCRLEAAFIAGSQREVEMATSALLDTSQSVADQLRELVFAQMRQDRIDPHTRTSF
jgi:hypothetical protein